jgi:beta-glucanase (GH16 family)
MRSLRATSAVGGEIDIMEMVGGLHNSSVMGTYHWSESQCYQDDWDKKNANYPAQNSSTFIDFSADYHVFAVTWTPYAIQWFVDGVQHFERDVGQPWNLFIPNTPMYMILNTALSW